MTFLKWAISACFTLIILLTNTVEAIEISSEKGPLLGPEIQVVKKEQSTGELVFAFKNEFSSDNGSQAQQMGLEGNYSFDREMIDGTLTFKQEDGAIHLDEARVSFKRNFSLFNHNLAVGPTLWRDQTIDAVTKVGGADVSTEGPFKTDLTGGIYYGGINLLGTNGNLVLYWIQVERKFGPVKTSYESFNGRIRNTAGLSETENGKFKKSVFSAVVDLNEIKLTRRIPLAVSLAVEKKNVDYSGTGPQQAETIGLIGIEVPLTNTISRIAAQFQRTTTREAR